MSLQKGNVSRSRSQKYQNRTTFKNNLHDTSHTTKFINSIEVVNVCERCKNIIEWKIKYKKYKLLKAPSKCTKCQEKCVKHTYHTICLACAKSHEVCPKCGQKRTIVKESPTEDENIKLDNQLQTLLKSLPERKRRTFVRYMNKQCIDKNVNLENSNKSEKNLNAKETKDEKSKENENESTSMKEGFLIKLKELVIKEGKDNLDDSLYSDTDSDSNTLT